MKFAAVALFLALAAFAPAQARSYRVGSVEVSDPWTRPAPAGATAVGYMVITNRGKAPLTLVSARSPAAKAVSLHQTTVANGVARMTQVSGGLTAAPGVAITLAPGGYHMMLEGLAKPLAAGERAPLTLVFANGQTVQIELSVQTQAGAAMGAMADMPGMDHSGH